MFVLFTCYGGTGVQMGPTPQVTASGGVVTCYLPDPGSPNRRTKFDSAWIIRDASQNKTNSAQLSSEMLEDCGAQRNTPIRSACYWAPDAGPVTECQHFPSGQESSPASLLPHETEECRTWELSPEELLPLCGGECPLHLHYRMAAQATVGSSLPTTSDIYTSQCRGTALPIMKDPTHPAHGFSSSPQEDG
ncbi:hypothetical protein AMECASPLE_027943 [Ameca splendens]|uniref:Uncharacterized protein n=1 Tax=Ameca splendens TaxID=208324 RepID=A0ABV1AD32_9TELE